MFLLQSVPPQSWITIAQQFGIPVVLLALFAWFFKTSVWPLIVRQLDSAVLAREETLKSFLSSLEKRDDVNMKQTEAITKVNETLEDLREEIRISHIKHVRETPPRKRAIGK